MKKTEKTKTNKDKQFYVPMKVTAETIRDFNIDPDDVIWVKIGSKWAKAVMIPVTEEQYYAYMRPRWNEVKYKKRRKPVVSIEKLYDENEYEIADDIDFVEDYEKKVLIEELHRALDELDELDRTIMDLFGKGNSETEIGKVIGMSQRGVSKRKIKLLKKLKIRLKNFM